MTDLVEFLRARIAEDEQTARECVSVNDLARAANGGTLPRWQIVDDGRTGTIEGPPGIPRVKGGWVHENRHITRWDPARVLAECEAKRRIVDMCARVIVAFTDKQMWPDVNRRERHHAALTLELLALPYTGHPDYREEWRP